MTVRFEATPLGRRGRLPDRAAIFALGLLVLIATAVLKPWGVEPTAVEPSRAAPALALVGRQPVLGARLPSTVDVQRALRPHAGWGVRSLANRPDPVTDASLDGRGPSTLREDWASFAFGPVAGRLVGGPDNRRIVHLPADQTVRLIGFTAPAGFLIRSVRVYQVSASGSERLPIVRIPIRGAGSAPFIAPRDDQGLVSVWRSGVYRIAVGTDVATSWVTVILGSASPTPGRVGPPTR